MTDMSTRPRILIVDDNNINLIVLKKVLENIDATLVEATNGEDALAATLDNDFALAILDVQMPGMDGYELAGHMRGNGKTKNVPIMFLTAAYDDEFHMFRGYEAGGVDYLTKPYQPEVLLAKIRVFLKLDQNRKELERHRNRLEEIVADRVRDIDHMNKVLKLLRELDHLIVHEKSSGTLIESACNILARVESSSDAWIILKDESSGETLSAHEGIRTEIFERNLDDIRQNEIPKCCRRIPAHQDNIDASQIFSDCGDCSFLGICKPDNVMISHLCHQEQHYGWISVTLPDDHNTSEQEIGLFRQVAIDLGFALHGIATQRERDKAARDLSETNRKLVRRSEEIQYFYHSLAHELKTPLTSAREFLSFVTEEMVGDLNETQAEYLGFVQESCANLVIYTNDLLDMTRLDTGKLSLNPESVPLHKLLLRVLSMTRNEAAKKSIQLRKELDPDIQLVDIDKSRITQVLFNLLTNALKFTPENGSVYVRLYRDPRRPDWICISVADTGCGIPEDKLAYIFRRYYQVDPTDHEHKDGFGLGLYLCKEIMKLHGGEIDVKSLPGKGSTFQLSLPLKQKIAKSPEKKKQKAYVF
jgi:signal transduction histidine kinase/CheY-like chemotaxis protein